MSLPGRTSEWCINSCSRNEKQQSGQAEVSGRAQAAVAHVPRHWDKLALYPAPLSSRLYQEDLVYCSFRDVPAEPFTTPTKRPPPKWDFWHTELLLRVQSRGIRQGRFHHCVKSRVKCLTTVCRSAFWKRWVEIQNRWKINLNDHINLLTLR